jgi:hypothetical protein
MSLPDFLLSDRATAQGGLPIGGTANVSTISSHLHRVATRYLDLHWLDRASFV